MAAVRVGNTAVVLIALRASAILDGIRSVGGSRGHIGPVWVVLITSHPLAILYSALLADEGLLVVLSLDSVTNSNLLLRIQAVDGDAGSVAVVDWTGVDAGFE